MPDSPLSALFDEKKIPHCLDSGAGVEPFPFFVTVFNVVSADLAKRYRLREGEALKRPLIEYRAALEGSVPASEEHILSFHWAKDQELNVIRNLALRLNDILKERGTGRFEVEFGLSKGDVLVKGVKI